jgi:hypothetical protein
MINLLVSLLYVLVLTTAPADTFTSLNTKPELRKKRTETSSSKRYVFVVIPAHSNCTFHYYQLYVLSLSFIARGNLQQDVISVQAACEHVKLAAEDVAAILKLLGVTNRMYQSIPLSNKCA